MEAQLVKEIEMLHSQVCHALGDPKRLLILYLLERHPYNVTELAAELNVPPPTVSRHLTILRDRSLVDTHREGTSVYYSLGDPRIIHALDTLRVMMRDRLMEQAKLADFLSPVADSGE